MGDGVMGMQVQFAQSGAKRIGAKQIDPKLKTRLEDKKRELSEEYVQLNLEKNIIYSELGVSDAWDWRTLGQGTFSETGKFTRKNYDELDEKLLDINSKQSIIKAEISDINTKLDTELIAKTSNWKRGDNISNRPWSAKSFENDNVEQFRATFYHEIGHHIHQQYKLKDIRLTPVSGTEPAWTQVQRPLEDRLRNVRNIKEHSPSQYGTTNTKEWFVENFSLYYRGKEELVAPEFLKILQEIKDDKIP
tara:strand:- start:164 stop:907 length:744 start_codon:yes stop_codon:yes gene_type:complete